MLPLISRSGGRIRGVSGAALAGCFAWTGREPGVRAPPGFAAATGRSFALAMGFLFGCDGARPRLANLLPRFHRAVKSRPLRAAVENLFRTLARGSGASFAVRYAEGSEWRSSEAKTQ